VLDTVRIYNVFQCLIVYVIMFRVEYLTPKKKHVERG
jgi:hypothetical protein